MKKKTFWCVVFGSEYNILPIYEYLLLNLRLDVNLLKLIKLNIESLFVYSLAAVAVVQRSL